MTTLEGVIDVLREFDQLRDRAADLRNKATEYLKKQKKPASPGKGAVEFIGLATQLIALQSADRYHQQATLSQQGLSLLDGLTQLQLTDVVPAPRQNVPSRTEEPLPLFVAARVLRALTCVPGYALREQGLYCYYSILRAFYTATSPDFTSGGIRAAGRGRATAFMTGECVQAFSNLEQSLRRTSELFEAIHEWVIGTGRARHPYLPAMWQEHEVDQATRTLRVTLLVRCRETTFESGPLLKLFDVKAANGKVVDEADLLQPIVAAIEMNLNAFGEATKTCEQAREIERTRARESSEKARDDRLLLDVERTESAHEVALRGLTSGQAATKDILDAVKQKHWQSAASRLKQEADRVRKILRAAESYLMSVLDREIAQASSDDQQHQCDYPELAFAASGYGALAFGKFRRDKPETEWDDPRLKRAAVVLSRRIGFSGRFPTGRPIALTGPGYRLDIIGSEVMRAFAELLENADMPFEPAVVRSMLRLYVDTFDMNSGGFLHEETEGGSPEEWTTALAALALDAIVGMLERTIRHEVTKHFNVRWPQKDDVPLEKSIFADVGLALQFARDSSCCCFERMRDHLFGTNTTPQGPVWSVVLYGPPGTGKTFLAEALARSTDCPLVEVTPSDLVVGGQDQVERRAKIVFDALGMLHDSVIVFDEFDSVLRQREPGTRIENIFEFLTPGMLPKLKALNKRAKKQRVAYVLTTNLIGDLDDAAIRDGRFDVKLGIYPPDLLSRTGRLVSEVLRWLESRGETAAMRDLDQDALNRIAIVIQRMAGGGMTQMGKQGWLTAPQREAKSRTPFKFIESGQDEDRPKPLLPEKRCPDDPPKKQEHNMDLVNTEWQEWGFVRDWDDTLKSDAIWATLNEALAQSPTKRSLKTP